MNRVVVAGDVNVNLFLRGIRPRGRGAEVMVDDAVVALGSAGATCATGLARLGTPVSFAGVVGDDPFGEYCLAAMRAAGVDVSSVRVDPLVRTGVVVSLTGRDDGARITYLGSVEVLAADRIDDDLLATATHLHASFTLQRRPRPGLAGLFRRAHRLGLTTSLDPGCDLSDRWGADLLDVLAEVDLFFVDQAELERAELPDALARLDNGVTRTIARRGPRDEGFVAHQLHAYVGGSGLGERGGVGGSPTSSAFIA